MELALSSITCVWKLCFRVGIPEREPVDQWLVSAKMVTFFGLRRSRKVEFQKAGIVTSLEGRRPLAQSRADYLPESKKASDCSPRQVREHESRSPEFSGMTRMTSGATEDEKNVVLRGRENACEGHSNTMTSVLKVLERPQMMMACT